MRYSAWVHETVYDIVRLCVIGYNTVTQNRLWYQNVSYLVCDTVRVHACYRGFVRDFVPFNAWYHNTVWYNSWNRVFVQITSRFCTILFLYDIMVECKYRYMHGIVLYRVICPCILRYLVSHRVSCIKPLSRLVQYRVWYHGTVLVLIKLTKFAVALWLRCGSYKLIFWHYFIIFRKI